MADGLTDDGDHPSIEGHRRLGERAFRLPAGY
jgi:lysophospholipase L1-like esterase